jgi:hypothetical protein
VYKYVCFSNVLVFFISCSVIWDAFNGIFSVRKITVCIYFRVGGFTVALYVDMKSVPSPSSNIKLRCEKIKDEEFCI